MNKILEKLNNDKIVKSISDYVKKCQNDIKIYLVGGILRDLYLDNENFDKDLVVANVNTEKFSSDLAHFLNASLITLDEQNKIYRLVLPDKVNIIDIAELVGNNIEDDLSRRDLTINSIALNLKTNEIIDTNDGFSDLKNKRIRHIGEQNFVDDPLRLLRVFRFQAALNFKIDAGLLNIVKKHSPLIKQTAFERINYELLKMFSGRHSSNALKLMDNSGLLAELLPASQELKNVPPNLHHHLGLFEHSIEVVKQIQYIFESSPLDVQTHLNSLDFGGNTRLAHLKFAGFLHDIGKPDTWTIEDETGKHRFIKHDDVGSKMCINLLKKLKFSKKQIEYISKMVKNHIYPSHVVSSSELNDKIKMRFVRKMENNVIDIIILAMADRLSARGVEITDEIVEKNINNLQLLLDYYLSIKDFLKPLPKLLSGEEIMELLNMKPSIELGNVIKNLKEAQISGEITTRDEAVKFLLNN